jgi:MarR family transcriptional regulator for hemolysin
MAKTASRVFDQARGRRGSQPVWQILISLKTSPTANQRELAQAVSIQGATLLEAAAVLLPQNSLICVS